MLHNQHTSGLVTAVEWIPVLKNYGISFNHLCANYNFCAKGRHSSSDYLTFALVLQLIFHCSEQQPHDGDEHTTKTVMVVTAHLWYQLFNSLALAKQKTPVTM